MSMLHQSHLSESTLDGDETILSGCRLESLNLLYLYHGLDPFPL